jgi:hypothetical protein
VSEPEQRPSDETHHSPPGLIFAAVAVGGLGIGFGIAATVLMLRGQQSPPPPTPSATATLPQPEPPRREGPWTDELHAELCAAPCCGGAACPVSADNAGKKECKEGDERCQSCVSTVSCIPGACGEMLGGDEDFRLHLSGVHERGPSGEPVDACKSGRDLWLCLKRRDEREWQCLSQREACSNKSRSPAGIALRPEELLQSGFELEVREGAPDGEAISKKSGALYKGGLQRRGLCGGFRSDFGPGPVSHFTFFLDVPGGPEPMRVAVKAADAGSDAGEADAAAAAELRPASSAAADLAPSLPSASPAPQAQ